MPHAQKEQKTVEEPQIQEVQKPMPADKQGQVPQAQKVQKMIDLKQQRVAAENDDDEDQITVRQGK